MQKRSGVSPEENTTLTIDTADGVHQKQLWKDVRDAELALSGEDAPLLTGPSIRNGMQLREIAAIRIGDGCAVSLPRAAALWGQEGVIDFFTLAAKTGGTSSDRYTVHLRGGETLERTVDELTGASATCGASGECCLYGADGTLLAADIVCVEAEP